MESKSQDRQFLKRVLILAGLALLIVYFGQAVKSTKALWTILTPLFLGFVIAYIVNILMQFIERHYFPRAKHPWITDSRRPVCLLLSYILIMVMAAAVMTLVLPKVVDTVMALSVVLPDYLEQVSRWFTEYQQQWPLLDETQTGNSIKWSDLEDGITAYATQGVSGFLTSSINLVSVLTSGLFNLLVALAFSVYLLMSKEALQAQASKLQETYLNDRTRRRVNRILTVVNESFTSFITGQCTEAVIIGFLCISGMMVFGFPYATSVGIFVGVTSLVPILGAYLGAAVGVLLIFPSDPAQALMFIVFIIVLQQIEGNLIYPKVMGTSIGLPGIWVFAAVVVGGGLGGVVGMLFGVPVAATLYKLIRIDMAERLRTRGACED